jgi:hypothetical protein
MSADVDFLQPKCPECSGPMWLVSVVCSRANVVHPPVRAFECALCETDAIFQGYPTRIDRGRAGQLHS